MPIAFFDLDKTLLEINSARLWMRWQRKQHRITVWQTLQASYWLTLYHLGVTGVEAAIRKAVRYNFTGANQKETLLQVQQFYMQELYNKYRPKALQVLQQQRALGHRLVLLTSALHELAELVTQQLHLDSCLCTHLQVDNAGNYTGQVMEPMCFGQGKLKLAQEFAQQNDVQLQDCLFYTDSVWDLPLLQQVGSPVVVNPDPNLRRQAKRQGWPIEDWGKAA
ncbi:MAG: HAD-IB family hydrolase [Myxococcota bacterium]